MYTLATKKNYSDPAIKTELSVGQLDRKSNYQLSQHWESQLIKLLPNSHLYKLVDMFVPFIIKKLIYKHILKTIKEMLLCLPITTNSSIEILL